MKTILSNIKKFLAAVKYAFFVVFFTNEYFKYETLSSNFRLLELKYNLLDDNYTNLSEKYKNVIRSRSMSSTGQFTADEIKTLISLCHPDKHDNKQNAVKITQKLLSLRK